MNQIKAGVLLNYVIIILNIILGLSYTPYMLRMLGQNEYGLYSLVASIIAYLTILDMGFGHAVVRYTSKLRAENNQPEQWRLFGLFLIIYSIIAIFALIVGVVLYNNVDFLFSRTMSQADLDQAREMMVYLIINLACTFPLSVFGSIITAYEDFIFQKLIQIVRILLCTGTLVVLLYYGYKAVAMVIVQTVFNLATLFINVVYCKYKLHIKIWFNGFRWIFIKEIGIYAFWLFLNAIMDRIYWSTGQFVLGAISGTIAVAIFSVAITLEQMYMTFSTSIAGVLLPRITTMVAKNHSNKSISDTFIKTGRLQALIMLLILSGFAVFGRGFVNLWAGPNYSEAYGITLIFFSALFIPLIQNVGISILQARNQMKFRSLSYLVIAILSLALQLLLAKPYGAYGCAVAIGGALLLGQGLVMNVYYAKKQKLDIVLFWKEIGSISIVPVFLTIIGIISWKYVDYDNIFVLIAGISIFICLYITLEYAFCMNSYERNTISQPIVKLFYSRRVTK